MKKLLYLLLVTVFLSCNNERVLELPEIESAEITEVLDVSHAYIFYDETQPDSTLFNRKNLIGTTNWLVNVDKRLTLKQAIPHIQYLQDKRKKASMHKNEAAKNYFTCNDKSIKNLGFFEFTDVNYITDVELDENQNTGNHRTLLIHFFYDDNFTLNEFMGDEQVKSDKVNLKQHFNFKYFFPYSRTNEKISVILSFDKKMSFQKYISIREKMNYFINRKNVIVNEEFIY